MHNGLIGEIFWIERAQDAIQNFKKHSIVEEIKMKEFEGIGDYTPSEFERNNDFTTVFNGAVTTQVMPNVFHRVETKDTNPKDSVGIAKVPMSTVPAQVIAEIGLGMMEGALKYGRHNYRTAGVRASVYYDAANRHLLSWMEGEDLDPDSGLSHISKALASLVVLRDSMMQENWIDDRPPVAKNPDWMRDLNVKAKALLEKYPNPKKAHTK